MAFNRVYRLLDNIIALNENQIINEILSVKEFQEYIISLNTEGEDTSQLYEHGIDSLGVKLQGKNGVNWLVDGVYANFTVQEKIRKGQRYDHPTLKNKGDFYRSFAIHLKPKSFLITADFNVTSDEGLGANLLDVMKNGKDVLGLTDENLQLVIDALKRKIIPIIRKKIFS
jgi:hypothetical protein